MPTIDANVLLRWLLDDVPAQTQAVERLLTRESRLSVPDVAMVEVGYVLERFMRLTRGLVADYLEAILGVTAFDVDRAVWGSAVADCRAHSKLSLFDCYLAASADQRGATPLCTFDKKLARQLEAATPLT